jgi:diaminopimelate decarboxylase
MSTISRFPVVDGCLSVGGIGLHRLVEQVGSTPFFAYDRRLITERVDSLRKCLPNRISLSYAIKANPMPEVVQHLNGLVDGFDVASALEMETALNAGMSAGHVSFAGPGKTDVELEQALSAGITVTLESEGEMRRLAALAEESGTKPRVLVRVNPDFQVKASAMRMGGTASQFGVDAERVPAMLQELQSLDLDLMGFHIFCGSQNLDADILAETQKNTIDLALRLARQARAPVTNLNIGGGFGIPYFEKDSPLDLNLVGERLGTLLVDHEEELSDMRILVELGRYIVGEAGVYVTRVLDRKESRGRIFLVTDGGLHHHLAASGNFGQVIRRNYPLAIGNRMDENARETVTVVGCLCTPLDLLGDKVELSRSQVGDLVVVFQSGAYGRTASPMDFLGHPHPAEILVG